MKYTKQENNTVRLVWACAWCDSRTYPRLKRGEEYTHGICTYHNKQLRLETAHLFSKRRRMSMGKY